MFLAEFCRLCVPQKNERKSSDLKSSPYGSPVFRSPAISRSASPGTHILNGRVAVAKDASPWQKQALSKLDASSMETTRFREPQGPLVASSLRSERYSPGPLRL